MRDLLRGRMGARKRIAALFHTPRAIALIAGTAVLVYIVWIGAPYLRSIAVRDAAVTTWITTAYSPIPGRVGERPLTAGARVGPDGAIAHVVDERLAAVPLAVARSKMEQAAIRLSAAESKVANLAAMVAERERIVEAFIALFIADLENEIANLQIGIESLREALALETVEAERLARMRDSGASSQSEADLAAVAVVDRQKTIADTESALRRAESRLAAARRGVLMIFDGSDAGSALRSLQDATDTLAVAEADRTDAEAGYHAERAIFEATERAYNADRVAPILAPPGAMIWSLVAGPGSEVQAGMTIATWVDCSVMLVDVPLPDLEAALLMPGAVAEVTIEGERTSRNGTVMFTRGSGATLKRDDLAAVAKGHGPGTGQAIVRLSPTEDDVAACPVGRAAYVDFPGIGVIDMLRARLRL